MTSRPTPGPARLVFVAGTGTGIGKTWWAAAVARELRAGGVTVSARKPVQSCDEGDESDATDAGVLATATGEDTGAVCPEHRTYRVAWAPPMAADELGLPPFTAADLVHETVWPHGVEVGLVEGVGGPRSPMASDADNVEVAWAFAPDHVVLVADAGLGTINAVRLSVSAFAGFPIVVALNRFADDLLHRRNLEVLESDGLTVVTTPTDLAARLTP